MIEEKLNSSRSQTPDAEVLFTEYENKHNTALASDVG